MNALRLLSGEIAYEPTGRRIALLTSRIRSTPSLIYKWGYDTVEELLERNQADYSLVLDGTLDSNCTTLLMLNVSLIIASAAARVVPGARTRSSRTR
jgi:hypothetical protein